MVSFQLTLFTYLYEGLSTSNWRQDWWSLGLCILGATNKGNCAYANECGITCEYQAWLAVE